MRFSETGGLRVEQASIPRPAPDEALIRVTRAGICGTDLQIINGYVPGFDGILGHEFVGVVTECAAEPELVGQRVVGGINCNDAGYRHTDPIFERNHAPGRSVLGIINRDGCFGAYVALPAANLVRVPPGVPDRAAAFAEPLAAACRITEQRAVPEGAAVAVVGDGRLGLLVAQVLSGSHRVTLFGRHPKKMALVQGVATVHVPSGSECVSSMAGAFDAAVEVTGSTQGIKMACALVRPMGTIVQKSTCSSAHVPGQPQPAGWAELSEDIVVNEKVIVGSRCGPMDAAVRWLQEAPVAALCEGMISAEVPLREGVRAVELARSRGVIKVQLVCSEA